MIGPAFGEMAPDAISFPTLESYEDFARQDWLFEHGSDEGQTHVRAKLEDEVKELCTALLGDDEENILDELGDVIWTATGSASNADIGLEQSFREQFPGYFSESPIRTAEIDTLSMALLGEQSLDSLRDLLTYHASGLGKYSKQWHNLKHWVDELPSEDVHPLIFIKRSRTHESLTGILLVCSATAQIRIGKSLEDAMIQNKAKLEDRKTKGLPLTRPPELRNRY